MSFRCFKSRGLRVVRIAGVPYILDTELKQLRALLDPGDVIELDDALGATH